MVFRGDFWDFIAETANVAGAKIMVIPVVVVAGMLMGLRLW